MIKNYFKTAWRSIARNKVYSTINILGLSLGICACLVIYLITSFELSYDTFHADKDRIYRVVSRMKDPQGEIHDMAGTIAPLPMAMRNEVSGFENVTAFYTLALKVKIEDGKNEAKKFDAATEFSPIVITEPSYFDMFKYKWMEGNAATALSTPFKVVLSENEARKYFGSMPLHDIIGKEVIYGDSIRFAVSGIVKDLVNNTDLAFKDFLSFATIQYTTHNFGFDLKNWGMWDYDSQCYIKLSKGSNVAQVEKQFPKFIKDHIKIQPGTQTELLLQPLSDIHFNSKYSDSYSRKAHLPTLYGLMAVAAFILIIAAINFINLSTARSLRRAKEVGVRKVLGGSKASLTKQFLVETFLVTTAAVVLAVLITDPVIASLKTMIPEGVSLNLFKPATLIFFIIGSYCNIIISGFLPGHGFIILPTGIKFERPGVAKT